jgi:hypothetical protein
MSTRWSRLFPSCLAFALTCGGLPLLADPVDVSRIDGPPPPVAPDVVARDETGRATLRAVRIEGPLTIDGRLDEAIYASVPAIADFVQQEPHEGAPATEATDVWVFFDDDHLYVAARCWDSEPDRIVADELRRDHDRLVENDNFGVTLDTFYDRRNGYLFYTTPAGALSDSLITDESSSGRDWNTVWEVRTARFERGWTVEMAIPFRSLRFAPGRDQIWGINFRRMVSRKNERSYLTPVARAWGRGGVLRLSASASLVGLEVPAGRPPLEMKPYSSARLDTDRVADPARVNAFGGDVGLDVKYGLTRGLTLDVTTNTDFAQVEVDEQQVNLTRFSLFFPEKRDFFLEGQGIFAFAGQSGGGGPGGGGGGGSTPILFFSRRIGLSDGQEVPIQVGSRLTGRAGRYSVGALAIRTGASPDGVVVPTTFSVVRVKRDVLRRSNVGAILTHRQPSGNGRGANLAAGLDASFTFFDGLKLNAYIAETQTPGLGGDERSYRAQADFTGDRIGFIVDHVRVGANFNPEVGYVRRQDVRREFGRFRFSPRPARLTSIRRFDFSAEFEYLALGDGRPDTRGLELQGGAELENGDSFEVELQGVVETLADPFDLTEAVVLGPGIYDYKYGRATYTFGPQRRFGGEVGVRVGEFYSGRRDDVSYQGRIEVWPTLSVEPRLSINRVRLPEGEFTAALAGGRVNYTFTPRMLLSALLQYNSSAETFGTNLRFRWEYRPGSELFVVYSEGRATERRRGDLPATESRSFVVKIARLVRF